MYTLSMVDSEAKSNKKLNIEPNVFLYASQVCERSTYRQTSVFGKCPVNSAVGPSYN